MMNVLISKTEIESILSGIGVEKYFLSVDMNGVAELVVSSDHSNKVADIERLIKQTDQMRTPDEINELEVILYPLKWVDIAEDEDPEVVTLLEKKDVVPSEYSQQLNIWLNKLPINKSNLQRPPRVAFYSYKGGVGRSTALAIVARQLAREGFSVAVIDLDLEAPGINSLLLAQSVPSPIGVVDYLYHAPRIRDSLDLKRF